MKIKVYSALIASFIAFGGSSFGAVSISIKNFTSLTPTSVGVPLVDGLGVPMAKSTIFASVGMFSQSIDWLTVDIPTILSRFSPIDATSPGLGVYAGSTPLTNSSLTGLFTGTDFGGAYPAGFSGKDVYIVVGNKVGTNLSGSTALAVYKAGTFTAVDGAGNASVSASATSIDSWVYGKKMTLASQPTNGTVFYSFPTTPNASAIGLVPEASTALLGALGALGLLRRRR